MIRTILIDDEEDARFLLKNQLNRHFKGKFEICGEADDVDEGVAAIKEHKPDLVFLDIQMKTGTGFDVLDAFDEVDFEVIFITAFHQFALEAFKFSAFGYLLKPIKTRDLSAIVEKLEKHLDASKSNVNTRLKVLVENYGDNGDIQKLIVNNIDGFQVVKIQDIIRLEGDRNYTHFILNGRKKITASKSLGEYEELLNQYGFLRVHQSTIISMRHVEGYQRGDGGMVDMTDGASVKVSRNRKSEFLKRFD